MSIRNLDMNALRAMRTVVDMGGVTKAADYLHLTQSAVSMQLKRLEEATGLALFDRSARQLALTAQGELLLSYARRMLALNDEAWGRLTADIYEGELVFGVPHDIVYPHIPTVLKRFSADYPKVKVRLVSSYTTSLLAGFERGDLDLIMTTEQAGRSDIPPLSELNLVWVGAKQGRTWKERPIRLASQERCLFRKLSQHALDQAGLAWEMAVDTDSSMTVSASISADLGIEARLDCYLPNDLEVIDHNGQLPELPKIHVHAYVKPQAEAPLANILYDMVLAMYAQK